MTELHYFAVTAGGSVRVRLARRCKFSEDCVERSLPAASIELLAYTGTCAISVPMKNLRDEPQLGVQAEYVKISQRAAYTE